MTSEKKKLCVITTHPIQYMAPWFRSLANNAALDLKVVFFRELCPLQQGVGFGQAFKWDVPLREGYESRVLDVAAGIFSIPRLLYRLLLLIRDIRPDAVMITGWNEPGLMVAYPLMKLLGIPVILRGESNSLRPRSSLTQFVHRLLLSFVDSIVVIGKANRQFYTDNKYPTHQLFEGAYFVESQRMLHMAEEFSNGRDTLRKGYGFIEQDFVFTFVGKHVPFKRPMFLVEAARLLRARGYPVKLVIAGSGELTEFLKQQVCELNVPTYFTGFLNQTEMWKAYVPADAFVLPSTNQETWGLVTNEAMLFGLPVIVCDQVGCGPDLVIEAETGYMFSGGAENLAAAMEKLIIRRETAPKIGLAGRNLVLTRYNMDVATEGLVKAFRYLVRH